MIRIFQKSEHDYPSYLLLEIYLVKTAFFEDWSHYH